MGKKSWIVTVIPLGVYLISFGFSAATGNDLSTQQVDMLQTLFYGFLGAGAIGAGKSTISKFANK